MGFAASSQGYLFNFWEQFNICFRQLFISPVRSLQVLSQILEIKQEKQSMAEYAAEFSNLATQSGLGPTHSIQLFLKGLNGQYKDLAVLILK
jgi:hypothetical protein